jgi:hypothetical protein
MADRSTLNLVGSSVSGQNLGAGVQIFTGKTAPNNLQFNTLSGGSNIQLIASNNVITISGSSGGGGTPGGADTNVQFNSGGSFSGTSDFTWTQSTGQLNVVGNIAISGTSILRAGAASTTSVELGSGANTTGIRGIAIGNNPTAGAGSFAIGYNATSDGTNAIAFGNSATIDTGANCAIAIGINTCIKGSGADRGIAIGTAAGCTSGSHGDNFIVMGYKAGGGVGGNQNVGDCSIIIGESAVSVGTSTVVIGCATTVTTGFRGIAIGGSACVTNSNSVAIGGSACATNTNSVAIGVSSRVLNTGSVGIGNTNLVNTTSSVAIGSSNTVNQSNTVTLGRSQINNIGYSFAVGFCGTSCDEHLLQVACSNPSYILGAASGDFPKFGIGLTGATARLDILATGATKTYSK